MQPGTHETLIPAGGECHQARVDPGFIQVALPVLRDPRLPPLAKLIHGRLKLFGGKDGRCYPSHATLAREVCSSVRAIKRHLEQLRDAGFVTWRRASRGNVYAVCDRPLVAPEIGHQWPTKRCSEKKFLKEPPPPRSLDSTKTGRTEAAPRGGGGTLSDSDEDEQRAFTRIERTAGVALDGGCRAKIAGALNAGGYSVAHLGAWLSKDGLRGASNPAGLLIVIAREFTARCAGFTWPTCLQCGDSAMVDGQPCTCCEAGQRRAAELAHKAEQARIKDEAQQKRQREIEEAEAVKEGHDQPLKDRGVCPECEGKGGDCKSCNGLGVWRTEREWRDLGICTWCFGVKTMWGHRDRACIACGGTGRTKDAVIREMLDDAQARRG